MSAISPSNFSLPFFYTSINTFPINIFTLSTYGVVYRSQQKGKVSIRCAACVLLNVRCHHFVLTFLFSFISLKA